MSTSKSTKQLQQLEKQLQRQQDRLGGLKEATIFQHFLQALPSSANKSIGGEKLRKMLIDIQLSDKWGKPFNTLVAPNTLASMLHRQFRTVEKHPKNVLRLVIWLIKENEIPLTPRLQNVIEGCFSKIRHSPRSARIKHPNRQLDILLPEYTNYKNLKEEEAKEYTALERELWKNDEGSIINPGPEARPLPHRVGVRRHHVQQARESLRPTVACLRRIQSSSGSTLFSPAKSVIQYSSSETASSSSTSSSSSQEPLALTKENLQAYRDAHNFSALPGQSEVKWRDVQAWRYEIEAPKQGDPQPVEELVYASMQP